MVAIGEIVITFGQILIAPFKNFEMLWIIIPIYMNWIITDYWQERKGTNFGNAMSNGATALWVGLDWTRQLFRDFTGFDTSIVVKLIVGIFFLAYGVFIMKESAQAKSIAHYIGRIREISYFAIVATPIYYGVIEVNLNTVLAILLFFPIWYFLAEAVDRALPAPKTDEEEGLGGSMGSAELGAGMPDMNAGLSNMDTGMSEQNQFGGQGLPPMRNMPKF